MSARKTSIPAEVAAISPSFVEIFAQVDQAEAAKLDQLVGIGLRKALEFLVKDFAAGKNPDKAEAIRKSLLASCIKDHINDSNVKACAERAAWLGNDETHYTKKWEDKDIGDLKLLVRLTVNWIENVVLTDKYMADMKPGKN